MDPKDLPPPLAKPEDFHPHKGQKLACTLHEQVGEAEVTEVNERSTPANSDRQPFSLLLRMPKGETINQGIAKLQHPDRGELELLVVPVGEQEGHILYEAVFT